MAVIRFRPSIIGLILSPIICNVVLPQWALEALAWRRMQGVVHILVVMVTYAGAVNFTLFSLNNVYRADDRGDYSREKSGETRGSFRYPLRRR